MIIRPGRNASGTCHAGQAGLLVDGESYYAAFYEAARRAEHYILLSGWQFDSDAQLIRGERALREKGRPTTLLRFLVALCEERPELKIYIIAWDYHVLFALEREWLQELVFHWRTHPNIHFRFDSGLPSGASWHRKYAVIDGRWAFLGGMDLCESRWDTRHHHAEDPLRVTYGEDPYKPYHDVQCFLGGEIAAVLAEEHQRRWACLEDEPLVLPPPLPFDAPLPLELSLRLPPGPVALSHTLGQCMEPPTDSVREVHALFVDAIAAARQVIYIETQYFTSSVAFRAIIARMRSAPPGLEIVVVLPQKPEAPKEEIALGPRQSTLMRRLGEEAAVRGHHFGVYYSATPSAHGEPIPTYIHSKVMIVDDVFLTVGSANMTNRSLALDAELNASWEAGPRDEDLRAAIAAARADLLAEHCGCSAPELAESADLVARLDALTAVPGTRLFVHQLENIIESSDVLEALLPPSFGYDPDGPLIADEDWEQLLAGETSVFGRALERLKHTLRGGPEV